MTASIGFRPAVADDVERIFHWRNNPFLMKRSTSQMPVTWDEHRSWFSRALQNPDRKILIVIQNEEPIGQVRFDRDGDIAVISDRKSTRLNSSHEFVSRMPSSA